MEALYSWISREIGGVRPACPICRRIVLPFGLEDGGLSSMDPRIAVASTYLDALRSHDGSSVPLAPDAVRHEVGLKTGFSGESFAAQPFREVLSIA